MLVGCNVKVDVESNAGCVTEQADVNARKAAKAMSNGRYPKIVAISVCSRTLLSSLQSYAKRGSRDEAVRFTRQAKQSEKTRICRGRQCQRICTAITRGLFADELQKD